MNTEKYPRLQEFLTQHPGWTVDMVIAWADSELQKKQGN